MNYSYNIMHSFWSKPMMHNIQDYPNSRKLGGWLSIKYLLLSSSFSCLSAKKYHEKVILYTDTDGYDLLIKMLGVSYDQVSLLLDNIGNLSHKLWVLGKFAAFKDQNSPFIHIDNDVYLWRKIPAEKSKDFLITQSKIAIPEGYRQTLREVFENFEFIPECILKKGIPENFWVANAGIIGGNDIDFFQNYCRIAEEFVGKNYHSMSQINIGFFNTILDEYLFSCLAEEQGRNVQYLIDVPVEESFKAVVRFNLVPFIDKYVHLVGYAKQNNYACEQMELRFKYEFPYEFKRISAKISEAFPETNEYAVADNNRIQRIEKAIRILYNSSIDDIKRKKVQLITGCSIREEDGEEEGEKRFFLCQENMNSLSQENSTPLVGMDELLVYFDAPISMNEFLYELKQEDKDIDEKTFAEQEFRLIDFVTEKIAIDGVLEFVN